jgi:hypothetical protein
MRSINTSVKLPQLLNDNREDLVKVAGAKSYNAMMVGMFIYAMYHGRPHVFTNAIMELSEEAQDEVIKGIVKKFQSGETAHGNYMQHSLVDAAATVAAGMALPEEKVIAELIAQLRKDGRGE